MVLYNHGNRPDHDCIYYFNLPRAQDANVVFHQNNSDSIIVHDNLQASAPDKVVTCASEDTCERKPKTSIKPEATLGERTDSRIKSQPEVLHTQDETTDTSFLISRLTKILKSPYTTKITADVIIIMHMKRLNKSNTTLCRIKILRFMLNKTATWNDMKFQRSKIVCNAKKDQDIRDQAKPFAAVVVRYKA